jgi:hypothetical protein
LATLQQPP